MTKKLNTHRDELRDEVSLEQEKSTMRLEQMPAVSHYNLDLDIESLRNHNLTTDNRKLPTKH